MLKDLTIFQKSYELIKWLHGVAQRLPKSERFVLAQRLENTALDFLSAVIEANASRDKAAALGEAEVSLEKLRIHFRLAFELRYVSLKQYETGSRQIDELGRLLGGWKKKFCDSIA